MVEKTIGKHYHICCPKYDKNRYISVVQGWCTYGNEDDKLEIMGLLTRDEKRSDSVVGWLTAEEVFNRIKKHLKRNINIIGMKFGRLTIISEKYKYNIGKNNRGHRVLVCKCDCGNTAEIRKGNVLSGVTRSCGCLRSEICRSRIETVRKNRCKNESK